jgi:hypothetical protein
MCFHEDGVRVAATYRQDTVYMDSYIWRLEDEFKELDGTLQPSY